MSPYQRTARFNRLQKMLLLVACIIGIAVAAVDDDNDYVDSLTVSEGGNLTISIHINKWDEDPQVLVTRLKESSQDLIAQLTCHNQVCEIACLISGVSLITGEESVTLILMNVSFSQTGLYKVCKLGDTQPENKIYNVTVNKPPSSTVSPDATPPTIYSTAFTAGITTAVLGIPMVITAAIIAVIYWKNRKANF
ncbi:uncharacterized protein si:rp71-80o10.4 [Pimephales promelas]|uniref:uncharacterized protein si:rp71-80o10.4 n=1 Tax=Pimephales promelas TaxID=90988 RepID=UPI0019555027|nr:uncharacterized protein si:rp71-80o10.4 [Pimephales promelas]